MKGREAIKIVDMYKSFHVSFTVFFLILSNLFCLFFGNLADNFEQCIYF